MTVEKLLELCKQYDVNISFEFDEYTGGFIISTKKGVFRLNHILTEERFEHLEYTLNYIVKDMNEKFKEMGK